MERGINLRGFRLELKYSMYTQRESGDVLVELMNKGSRFHDMKIAEYYAARGKLTNLDATYFGHTALTHAFYEGHLDIVEALLAAGADKNKGNCYTPLIWAAKNGH